MTKDDTRERMRVRVLEMLSSLRCNPMSPTEESLANICAMLLDMVVPEQSGTPPTEGNGQ